MRRWFPALASLMIVFGFTAALRAADDDPKAIIAKAIKAEGGEGHLTKYKAAQVKTKGKINIEGLGETDFTQEVSYMMPDKVKESLEMQVMGQNFNIVSLLNGDKVSIEANGKEIPLTDTIKDSLKEVPFMLKVMRLVPLLKDKNIELSPLGDSKVEGKPAVGVRVSAKGQKDISLYFNKETGLLAKLERRTVDPNTSKELTEERIFLEYAKNKDGDPIPKKVLVKHDGKKFIDAEVTEWKDLESLDDSEFKK